MERESIFNKWYWHNWMSTRRNGFIYARMHKFKSKWIKDLNINPVTLNLIEEKMGNSLEHIAKGDSFLNITAVAQALRLTVNGTS